MEFLNLKPGYDVEFDLLVRHLCYIMPQTLLITSGSFADIARYCSKPRCCASPQLNQLDLIQCIISVLILPKFEKIILTAGQKPNCRTYVGMSVDNIYNVLLISTSSIR